MMNRYCGSCGHMIRNIRTSDPNIPVVTLPIKCEKCDEAVTPEVVTYFIKEYENQQTKIVAHLKRPRTMWIEDRFGNLVSKDTLKMPDAFTLMEKDKPRCYLYANFRSTVVKHTVFSDKTEKNPSGLVLEGECSVGALSKSIGILVLNYGWRLNDACILFSILCEGCMNTVAAELEGWDYAENPGTCCDYCDTIRPGCDRPRTVREEKGEVASILALYGLSEYSKVLGSENMPTEVVAKRIVVKDTVTGHYRIVTKDC